MATDPPVASPPPGAGRVPPAPAPPASALSAPAPWLRWKQVLLWVGLPLAGILLLCADQVLRLLVQSHHPRMLGMAIAGLLGAALIVLVLAYLGLRHLRARAHHVAAVEKLTAVSASINARLGEGEEVLRQLAEAARQLLDMATAAVLVLEPEGDTVRVASAVGAARVQTGQVFLLSDAPVLRACVIGGQTIALADAQAGHADLDLSRLRAYGVRGMIMAPLRTEGRVVGALVVADPHPHPVPDDQRRLAELWASQAAVILQNQRMYQRLREAMAEQRELEAQREALTDLSLRIYAGESLAESLQAVADRAPALLRVDALTIAILLDIPSKRWEMLAVTDEPETRALRGMRFVGGDSPVSDALRRRQPVEVPDAPGEARLQQRIVQALRARSLLFIPISARDGTPIALMTLVLRRPGRFSAGQRQMAQYLVTRLGAAMEMARLRERALADGQAKATLLRELHHRVKNNLAGIAGLLSINQPELPREAQDWLDRVGERIRAMARAHELFSGEETNLSLRQLFRATLSSLSVAQPAGIRVELDDGGVDAALGPDRAVALVMILHELCHNAMVHGLGENGLLRVECRLLPLRQLIITVTDDGSAPRGASAPFSSGMGLGLVHGLTRRELRGEFHLMPVPGGGTRAWVQFRLLDPERVDVAASPVPAAPQQPPVSLVPGARLGTH